MIRMILAPVATQVPTLMVVAGPWRPTEQINLPLLILSARIHSSRPIPLPFHITVSYRSVGQLDIVFSLHIFRTAVLGRPSLSLDCS